MSAIHYQGCIVSYHYSVLEGERNYFFTHHGSSSYCIPYRGKMLRNFASKVCCETIPSQCGQLTILYQHIGRVLSGYSGSQVVQLQCCECCVLFILFVQHTLMSILRYLKRLSMSFRSLPRFLEFPPLLS